jgi:sodium-dependent phosphate cotransporter
VVYKLLVGTAKVNFEKYIFSNPYKSFGWGGLLTASIQSSSVTTSLILPLVAKDKVKLKDAFPFVMGANVGTTITALLAALFKTDTAISIAIAHLLFNFIGALIFLPFPVLRRLPVKGAEFIGSLVVRYRSISLLYIIITFFLLPFAFIYFSKH